MTEQITEEQKQKEIQDRTNNILVQERRNSGSSWTRNEEFEKNGYYVVKNLWDPKELFSERPEKSGIYNYYGKKEDQFNYNELEHQVKGSTARYWHPQYREIHSLIRIKLEKIIGRKLYNTYYYDRFYSPGQELDFHADRDACEISVSVHISTNLEGDDANWPFCIKTPDTYSDEKKTEIVEEGERHCIIIQQGDGVIYKGCERPHWRDPMPGGDGDYYYHQIFFHYVLQDGIRAHHAWDRGG
jgi:hypothetical protein